MSRIAYVNGRFLPMARAGVGVEDRGLQFADAVYEVWRVADGRLQDSDAHFARLERSLHELRIGAPMGRAALEGVLGELLRRNRVREGLAYLQVTRGQAPRDHAFPTNIRPTVIATAKALNATGLEARAQRGVAVITLPDVRWGRCDIKTTGLTANVLAKQAAREAGAYEAWLLDSAGAVTEGSSTNAWIVTGEGTLVTRPAADNILNGVTRRRVLQLAEARGLRVEERPFTPEEEKSAAEAFLTSASGVVTPVIVIDGAPVGSGRPGPHTLGLREAYLASPANP